MKKENKVKWMKKSTLQFEIITKLNFQSVF